MISPSVCWDRCATSNNISTLKYLAEFFWAVNGCFGDAAVPRWWSRRMSAEGRPLRRGFAAPARYCVYAVRQEGLEVARRRALLEGQLSALTPVV